MARLLQAALPLLLLASFAYSDDLEPEDMGIMHRMKGAEKYGMPSVQTVDISKKSNFNSNKMEKSLSYLTDTSFESLKTQADQRDYLESLLVAKTCFREWIRDEECHMRAYEAAKDAAELLPIDQQENAKQKAEKDHQVGFQSHVRLTTQMADLKKIQNKSGDYFKHVTNALKDNFNEMVKQARADQAAVDALVAHLASDEFKDMFKSIKKDYSYIDAKDGNKTKTGKAEDMNMVHLAMEEWVEAEKKKYESGELSQLRVHGWGKDHHKRWDDMQNKIPETLKYNTRGSTPYVKKHLRAQLDIACSNEKSKRIQNMTDEYKAKGEEVPANLEADCDDLNAQYNKLKQKSAAVLMAQANQMRHEAMEKSNSIIAYVMHKMAEGDHDMSEMLGPKSHNDRMKAVGHGRKMHM